MFKDLDSIPEGIAIDIFCKIWYSNSLFLSLSTSSGYNLLVLTIERYLAITRPFSYNENNIRNKLWFVIPTVWISGFIFVLPDVFLYKIENEYCVYTAGSWNMRDALLLYFYFAVVGFLFPGIMMIILYLKMANVLIQQRKVQHTIKTSTTTSDTLAEAQQNILITCFILVALYLSCWLWTEMVMLLYLSEITEFSVTMYHISTSLLLFNSAINPFIYTIRYKEFQHHIKIMFYSEDTRCSVF